MLEIYLPIIQVNVDIFLLLFLSLLVGVLMSKEFFSPFVSQSLLFLSFVIATFLPLIVFKAKRF